MLKKYKPYIFTVFSVLFLLFMLSASLLTHKNKASVAEKKNPSIEEIAQLKMTLQSFGVTNDTFANGPVNFKDFYIKKTLFEGEALGTRKFEIPKSYFISYFNEESPDTRELKTKNDVIKMGYVEPDKHSIYENVIEKESVTKLYASGKVTNLSVSGGAKDFNKIPEHIKKLARPTEEDAFSLIAYKYPPSPRDPPEYPSKHILYLEYKENKVNSVIDCYWKSKKTAPPPKSPMCMGLSSDKAKNEEILALVCSDTEVDSPPMCTHIFNDENLSYGVTFPADRLQNWNQNRLETINFFKQFEKKSP